jgi:hypothetical protein
MPNCSNTIKVYKIKRQTCPGLPFLFKKKGPYADRLKWTTNKKIKQIVIDKK